jgi:hypothetical protein
MLNMNWIKITLQLLIKRLCSLINNNEWLLMIKPVSSLQLLQLLKSYINTGFCAFID